jgi:hypothetical protein
VWYTWSADAAWTAVTKDTWVRVCFKDFHSVTSFMFFIVHVYVSARTDQEYSITHPALCSSRAEHFRLQGSLPGFEHRNDVE